MAKKDKHQCGECSEFDFCLNEMQMKRLCSDGIVRVIHRKMEACSDIVLERDKLNKRSLNLMKGKTIRSKTNTSYKCLQRLQDKASKLK